MIDTLQHIGYMHQVGKVALNSQCKRAQVGAVLVIPCQTDSKQNPLRVFEGYNHNPSGCCEGTDGRTLPSTRHAEIDVMLKAATTTASLVGATLYVTRQPCIQCAIQIVALGVTQVFFRDADDKPDGIEYLKLLGVKVHGWIQQVVQADWLMRNLA